MAKGARQVNPIKWILDSDKRAEEQMDEYCTEQEKTAEENRERRIEMISSYCAIRGDCCTEECIHFSGCGSFGEKEPHCRLWRA